MGKFRFGMSSCGMQELTEQNFIDMKNSGVKELELSFAPEKYKAIKWEEIKEKAERYGINLWSLHLPFGPFSEINPADENTYVHKNTLNYFEELIKKATSVGIKVIVVHPSGEPIEENEREKQLETAGKTLSKLADIAEKYDAVIAVEDLPRTCLGRDSYDIKEILSYDNRLRVCFDTNHLLSQKNKDFILDIGNKIITTHFSDYDLKNERHWLPGEGVIDWGELIECLENVGYEGPLLYEMGFKPPITIKRRELTMEDFKENHRCLVNKLPLLKIGAPIEENCVSWLIKPW